MQLPTPSEGADPKAATSLCCWSSQCSYHCSALGISCGFYCCCYNLGYKLVHILYNISISPYSNFKKRSLEKISLHKWGKRVNLPHLHLFQESVQNWQIKKTKTGIKFHLQGYFSAVSPSLQTRNSRAWRGSNKFPSNTVMCLSAWKNRESGEKVKTLASFNSWSYEGLSPVHFPVNLEGV